jgi:hypothetical protein
LKFGKPLYSSDHDPAECGAGDQGYPIVRFRAWPVHTDSVLADDGQDSFDWRLDFIRTFMERDIPSLGFNITIPVIECLWLLLAHYHGQTVNYHKLAGAADISIPKR